MVSKNLLRSRIAQNALTQKQLAELIGISPNSFSSKINGKKPFNTMRSIKSAQCYISRTISRRQKFFCKNRPIFGMIRDAEVRGGERMQTETKSKALHSVFIDTESKTYLFDGKPMQGMLGLDLHIEPDNNYVTIKYCLECRQVTG